MFTFFDYMAMGVLNKIMMKFGFYVMLTSILSMFSQDLLMVVSIFSTVSFDFMCVWISSGSTMQRNIHIPGHQQFKELSHSVM